jgi:hypothetical protein
MAVKKDLANIFFDRETFCLAMLECKRLCGGILRGVLLRKDAFNFHSPCTFMYVFAVNFAVVLLHLCLRFFKGWWVVGCFGRQFFIYNNIVD